MRPTAANQQGVALVQVIITTAIILLLVIFYLGAAKSQVTRAQALQDKTDAYMNYYTANSQVLYNLLTGEGYALQQQGWNFHGTPMSMGQGTTVAVQDLNGLLSLPSMTHEQILEQTLSHTLEPMEAKRIAHSVMDWIDPDNIPLPLGAEQGHYVTQGITPRNGPILTYTEFAFINGMTYQAEQALIENTTIHPTAFFNPMSAPVNVLAAYSDSSRADDVMALRRDRNYDRNQVEELTGVFEDEGIGYMTGPGFRLTINAKVGESYFGKVLEYAVYPYRAKPLEVLSRLPRQQIADKN